MKMKRVINFFGIYKNWYALLYNTIVVNKRTMMVCLKNRFEHQSNSMWMVVKSFRLIQGVKCGYRENVYDNLMTHLFTKKRIWFVCWLSKTLYNIVLCEKEITLTSLDGKVFNIAFDIFYCMLYNYSFNYSNQILCFP